jgi:hypothetical protein
MATAAPIERCPTGAIIWIDEKKGPVKGLEAKKITRKTPLPVEEARLPVVAAAGQSSGHGAGARKQLV